MRSSELFLFFILIVISITDIANKQQAISLIYVSVFCYRSFRKKNDHFQRMGHSYQTFALIYASRPYVFQFLGLRVHSWWFPVLTSARTSFNANVAFVLVILNIKELVFMDLWPVIRLRAPMVNLTLQKLVMVLKN